MARIFISYSRGEREVASRLAERLTENGYDVWWDAAILGGTRFEDEITEVLGKAEVAIILWSKGAATSDWVRAEAEIARVNKTALPVVIDDVDLSALPILFQQIHAIDLRHWDGNAANAGYQQILKSIASRINAPSAPKPSAAQPQPLIIQDSIEGAAWAELERTKDVSAADYRSYLKQFPNSQFKAIAELRLQRLQRRRARYWSILGPTVLVALAAVIGTAMVFRPDLAERVIGLIWPPPPPVCSPDEELVKAPTGHFSVCQDASGWKNTREGQMITVQRTSADGTVSLYIRNGEMTPDPDKRLDSILKEADNQDGTLGKSAIAWRGSEQVDDRVWYIWEYTRPLDTGKIESNVVYYYTERDYGFVELTVYSSSNGMEALQPYASKLVKTARFK